MVQGFRSRAVLVEQGDEPAADNGTGGMLLGRFQGLPVADAEADHTRMGQSHLVYTVEVGLFGAVELFLYTGSGSRRYHVDKTVRVPVDETDTLFARFRRDEHDDFQPVAVGYGFECFHIVPEGEVGDDDPVYPAVCTALAKGFETIMEDGVEVSHQYQGDFHVLPDVFQLLEEAVQAHAVLQGFRGSVWDDGSGGYRVAEGDADFQHVYASCGQCADDVSRTSGRRVSGTEIQRKDILFLLVE